MSLTIKNLKITFDYLTIACFCAAVIISGDSRYIIAALSALLHESGHIAVMLMLGEKNIDITMNLFNVAISDRRRGERSYSDDVAVICAGPAVNFILFIICGVTYKFTGSDFFYNAFAINALLCVFNLLPMESTDGGQLLLIFLGVFLPQNIVGTIITVLTFIIMIPVGAVGFCVLLGSGCNYTLFFSSLYFIFMLLMRLTE